MEAGQHRGPKESVVNTIEVDYRSRHGVEDAIGRTALSYDGFEPLGEARSKNEQLRQEIRIVDQDQAVDSVIEALDRESIRSDNDGRPVAVLAFLGPTGVGKSELAKELARVRGGQVVKIDCADFSEKHNTAKLIGSPPGYVGQEVLPTLRAEVVENPGTVVLFDEIEKGSVDLYNKMLSIMGDGELELASGTKVSFRDTVVIMTSNLGAREMIKESGGGAGFSPVKREAPTGKKLDAVGLDIFNNFFSPEFVNRINKQVVFKSLSEDSLAAILDNKVDQANQEFRQKFGINLALSDGARRHLVDIAAGQPNFGARPLVRALEDNVYSVLGRHVSAGNIEDGTRYHIFSRDELPEEKRDASDSALVFLSKRDISLMKKPLELKFSHKEIAVGKELAPYDESTMERDWGADIRNPIESQSSPYDRVGNRSYHLDEDAEAYDSEPEQEMSYSIRIDIDLASLSVAALTAASLAVVAQNRFNKFRTTGKWLA